MALGFPGIVPCSAWLDMRKESTFLPRMIEMGTLD